MIKMMNLAGALCAFGIVVAACSGGGGEDTEDGSSGECTSDSDCKGDRVCSEGACVDQPSSNGGSSSSGPPPPGNGGSSSSGPPPPEECSANSESCASTNCCTEPTDLCVDYGGSLGTVCGFQCEFGNECQTGCCASLPNGDGVCAPTDYCGIPAYCEGPTNCLTDTCVGWCTDYCSTNSGCPGDTWCVLNNANDQICFVGCDSNADCSYYPGTSCQYVETVSGFDTYVCAG